MFERIKALLGQIFRKVLGKRPDEEPVSPGPLPPERLRVLSCLEGKTDDDPVVASIRRDLEGKTSVLELMKSYIGDLEGELSNAAAPFARLSRLFDYGTIPANVAGHHYGVTLGLRTGGAQGVRADYSNLLGVVWSTSLGKVSPWVGKTFTAATSEQIQNIGPLSLPGDGPAYTGINHFHNLEDSPLNAASVLFLSFWLNLKDAPYNEKIRYGYQKVGGQFIARRDHSVYAGSNRDVFQLNYRYAKLSNPPPLRYLIDEIVEIADGLYLGQLLFATRRLFSDYDPRLAVADNAYEHFGYFLLMDQRWEAEARRTFPGISVPSAQDPPDTLSRKLTSFTFAIPPEGNCNDQVLAQVEKDMKNKDSIIDLLKFYSDELRKDAGAASSNFDKLQELFNRGIAPEAMGGFYRGAMVSFRSEGLIKIFGANALNAGWRVARLLTPWNGKDFQPITPEKLAAMTDNNETGQIPTFWGSNTYSLRTPQKKIAGEVMKMAGIWTEDATEQERLLGYDLKSFFFIGRQGDSVNPDNRGKKVFQFNYRWPKLRTFTPDNYCVDEIVQIAEGLYLGQLTYATDLLLKYDPATNPADYKYGVFGYFLLMDKDWHRRRMQIGFDLDNV